MSVVRVLACFKVTPDFEALREADWVADAADSVETRYVRRILNCFDECALELALRLCDAAAPLGVTVDLGALCVGDREVEPYLKTLVALGYERATRVASKVGADLADVGPDAAQAGLDFAPAVVASIIAEYVRRVDHSDLLLLGCRSGPGDSGTVPFLVAERLGWPCLTQVTDVEPLHDGGLRVACTADDALLRLTLRGPCVLAVGNAVVSHLRVPTLKDRLARRERRIDVLSATDLGLDVAGELRRATCILAGLETIERDRHGTIVAGETPRDKALALFEGHLRGMIETL